MAILNHLITALFAAGMAASFAVPMETYPRRQVSNCADSATSAWNVSYTVYCNTNQAGWDLFTSNDPNAINKTPGQSVDDCINQCSTQWGPCRGVVFDSTSNTCWFKNATFAFDSDASGPKNGSFLAVPKASQVGGLPTACPFDDNSTQQSSSGQNFTIHCEQDIVGKDMTPQGATQGVGYPYHTNSLADCMDLCSKTTPNCQGVAWNPDLDQGFGNCYMKFNAGQPFQFVARNGSMPDSDAVIHTAVAHFPTISAGNYTAGEVVNSTSGDGAGYALTLDQNMPGNDISQFHTTSLESCVTACDELTTAKCVGAVFDSNYTSGWSNCWLKSAVGTPQQNDNGYIWAAVSKATANKTPDKSSGSQAWIAGVVIGVLAAIALLGGLVWFLLRRRRPRRAGNAPSGAAGVGMSYVPLEQQSRDSQTWQADYKRSPSPYAASWQDAQGGAQATQHAAELSPQAERNGALPPAELGASIASPHEIGSSVASPQELGGGWSPAKMAPSTPAELPAVSSPHGETSAEGRL